MKRLALPLMAVALLASLADASARQDSGQATAQRFYQAASEYVAAATAAVAGAPQRWTQIFVGRLKRADGSPRDAQEVLSPIDAVQRQMVAVRADVDRLKAALEARDPDPQAFTDQLDSVVERAVLAPWQLALGESHLAIQLVQGEYDDAIADATRRLTTPAQAEALRVAAWEAGQTAAGRYTAVTDQLVAARARTAAALERWRTTVARDATTAHVAEAIETNLDVTPGCSAAIKTTLDRFLCAHEVVLSGAAGVSEVSRLQMASAFDAFDLDKAAPAESEDAPYFFREGPIQPFVAGYHSLQAPIWPPELHPWARSLPPALATAIDRGSRILLFHGKGIVPVDGTEPALVSEDARVVYQLLATSRGGVPAERRNPVTWDGFMKPGWSRDSWFELTKQLLPFDAPQSWRDAMDSADVVMVLARVLPGALPGQKNLRVSGVPTCWVLPMGTAQADLHFVRERVPGDFEPIQHGFVGESVRVSVQLDAEIALDTIPVTLSADSGTNVRTQDAAAEISRTLVATRDAADRRLYVTPPVPIEYLPDFIRVPHAGVIPATHDDGLAAGTDTNDVLLRSPARLTVARDPTMVANSWSRAIERAAAVYKTPVGQDRRAFLAQPAKTLSLAHTYKMPGKINEPATVEPIELPVTYGDHAALLMLRDELLEALHGVDTDMTEMERALRSGDLRARTQLRSLEIELADPSSPWRVVPVTGPADSSPIARVAEGVAASLGDVWSSIKGKVPLVRIMDDAYVAKHFEYWAGQRWRMTAAQEAAAFFRKAVRDSISHASAIHDDDLEGLLYLVRLGFTPVMNRVLPDVLMPAPTPSGWPWRPDPESRQFVRGAPDLAERFARGKALGDLHRSIAFVAVTVATFVAAPEALAFRVLQVAASTLGAVDLAAFSIPEYLRRRAEVRFAMGASPVLGADRLNMAEVEEIPTWSMAIDVVLTMAGGAGDLHALFGQIRMTREAARTAGIVEQLGVDRLRVWAGLTVEGRANVTAVLGEALAAKRARRPLTPLQQRVLSLHEAPDGSTAESIWRAERNLDLPPGWHLPSHVPAAIEEDLSRLQPPAPVIRALNADGDFVTYNVGNPIGSGTGALVYECTNVPDVVLKLPRPGGSAAEWLDAATRGDGFLQSRGIRRLGIVAVASEDAPVPFYVQMRVPKGARRFQTQPRVIGYEVTRPGIQVPANPTDAQLEALAARFDVRLEVGAGLPDNVRLPRPIQRAVLRLYKRVAQTGLIAEDLHLDNLYFVQNGLQWEAGVLDLERVGPWDDLLGADQQLAELVQRIELLDGNSATRLPSMRGRDLAVELRRRLDTGAERLYPDADFFMEKMLEYKGFIRYMPNEQRWTSTMIDLDLVEEYFPDFRSHVAPDMVELAERRALGVPGPRVPLDVDPVPSRPWPESPRPRGPPPDPPAPTPPAPTPRPPRNDPYAPTDGAGGGFGRVGPPPRTPSAIGIPDDAITRRDSNRDLVYGIYNKEPISLAEWARARGGQIMDDTKKTDPRAFNTAVSGVLESYAGRYREQQLHSARLSSVAGLQLAIDQNRQVHFDLTGMERTAAWDVRSPYYENVTSYELRFLRRRWDAFKTKPKFYQDGRQVDELPWQGLPPEDPLPPLAPKTGPRPPGPGGPADPPRPFGLTTDRTRPEPKSERLPDPPEYDPTSSRDPLTPAQRQKRLQDDLDARWKRQAERNVVEDARLAEEAARREALQRAAPRFDVSMLPASRRTTPRNLNDGLAPVRILIPDDNAYVGAIMAGSVYEPSQSFLYADLVNEYVAQILAGGPFPPGKDNLTIMINQYGVLYEGHHRYVAAQIVSRLTGRPLFTGANRVIPADMIIFNAIPKGPVVPTSWNLLGIRPPLPK